MQVRFLNLLEYQSKVLMQNHGVNIQKFKMVRSADDAKNLSKDLGILFLQLLNFHSQGQFGVFFIYQFALLYSSAADEYVVKAQILAGGRGKGHFDNGFKGGVHITKE